MSESQPSRPFALFAAHLPEAEQATPAAAAWAWSALPLPGAEPEAWPAAAAAALAPLRATVLQVPGATPPESVGFEAVVLHR